MLRKKKLSKYLILNKKKRCKIETSAILANDEEDEFANKVLDKPKIKILNYNDSCIKESQLYLVSFIR